MKEKRMELKEDYGDMPKGSTFVVEKETQTLYKGIWPSMMGTCLVSVPKTKCKKYREKKITINKNSPAAKKLIKLLVKKGK